MSGVTGCFAIASLRARAIVGAMLVSALLLVTGQAQAEWIRATGHAAVANGDRAAALAQAKDNALREAALRYQAQIASEDTVENGVLTHSRLTVNSRAQARELRIVSERIEGDYALVTIEADMAEAGACEGKAAQNFRKRVAIAGFALVGNQGVSMGNLHDVERALPEYLYQRLLSGNAIEPFSITQRRLYGDVRNSPTVSEANNRVHKTLGLARDLNVQFVVGGVIRDLGPVDEAAWGTSVVNGWKRGLGLSSKDRRFVVDLVVHDGFSGSPIMERRYQATGTWDAGRNTDIGFMTPAFMATHYGQAVSAALEDAVADIGSELRCQPFMTRIARIDGHQVYLESGASSRLRPGQDLDIYRRFEFIDVPGNAYELQPTGTRLRIDQVHPEFSRGQIPLEAARRNIQQDDIAIIW